MYHDTIRGYNIKLNWYPVRSFTDSKERSMLGRVHVNVWQGSYEITEYCSMTCKCMTRFIWNYRILLHDIKYMSPIILKSIKSSTFASKQYPSLIKNGEERRRKEKGIRNWSFWVRKFSYPMTIICILILTDLLLHI